METLACSFGRLAHLAHWFDAAHVRDVRRTAAARRHVNDLIEYLHANRLALVNYGWLRHDVIKLASVILFHQLALCEQTRIRAWR